MKWLLGIALALTIVGFPTFADANLHRNQLPTSLAGVVSNYKLDSSGDWIQWNYKDALAGKYAGKTIVFNMRIYQISPQADGSCFYWNALDYSVVVRMTQPVSFLQEGYVGVFICQYVGNAKVTKTNPETGQQTTSTIPLLEASAAGIHYLLE